MYISGGALTICNSVNDQPRSKCDIPAGVNTLRGSGKRLRVHSKSAVWGDFQPIARSHPRQLASLTNGDDNAITLPNPFRVGGQLGVEATALIESASHIQGFELPHASL